MKKVVLLPLTLLLLCCFSLQAQELTLESLKAMKAEKQAQVDALTGEIGDLQGQIDALPGWTYGTLGTIGFSAQQFNNWFSREDINTYSGNIGVAASGFANLMQDKYFWRNNLGLVLGWTKLATNATERNVNEFKATADAFNISSLFGYKLSDKWALSVLGEYRTTVLNGTFNNPGYLDIGAGLTWTPVPALVVVFHPLNYNIVMAKDDILNYESSLGCKIVADYAQSLPRGIAWKSNLSAFVSYKDPATLSNWTWVNGFSFNIFKGIGVGFEVGLRGNTQEVFNYLNTQDVVPEGLTLENATDNLGSLNALQSYWLMGLTYTL